MIEPLSPRQREALSLMAKGLNNAEIARAMVIEPRTLEGHISEIYQRLGVRGRGCGNGAARVRVVLWWLEQEKADE